MLDGFRRAARRVGTNRSEKASQHTASKSKLRVRPNFFAILAVTCGAFLAFPSALTAQTVATSVNPNDPSKKITGIAVNPTENYVYVTQGDGNLTILNAATNQVVASSAAGTNGARAMATYLNNVFVVNGGTNNISVYFPVSPAGPNGSAFQQTFGDGNAITPTAIVVDPSGTGKLFVSNSGSNNVSVFTLNEMGLWQQVATPGVGANPQAMVINQVTHKVYVADLGDNKVWVIDASTNAVLTSINVGTAPRSIAVNEATNKIYVPGFGSNDLTVIDGTNNTTQTISGIGNGPGAVAVNPLTNQIYVANIGSSNISIVSGADNSFTNVDVASGPASSQSAIVVDPQTNIAYVSINGGNVTAVDGGTQVTTNLAEGAGGNSAIALNPVTHKVYVAATDPLTGDNVIGVLDGAANASQALTGQSQPWAIAVNPATNKVYVSNSGENNVSIIDGMTNTITASADTGTNPGAIAVDPARNLIYVANFNGDSVTIIDGATNNTNTQNIGTPASPDSLAVNPVLRQVYGAASGQNVEFDFQSNLNPANSGWDNGNPGPIARATNPATGMAYTLYSSGSMDVDDGAAPHSFNVDVCQNPTSAPAAFDVNTQTNTVYIACAGNEVDVIQGASGFFGGNETSIQDSSAVKPAAVAVNSASNQIFVANAGSGSGDGSVTIIDGATNNFINVPVSGTPVAIAVNPATDKVYVETLTGAQASSVVVIDGIAQKILTTVAADWTSNLTEQIAANPVNGTVYTANRFANTITSITENAAQTNGLTTTAQPFAGNTTNTTSPAFTFTVTNALDGAQPYVVYYQVDSQTGIWNYAGNTGTNTFGGTPGQPLTPGFHVVYAYAVNGGETGAYSSGGSLGNQHNPQVGAIGYYGFLVSPPIAGVPYYPEDFGTTPVNVATAAHQPILVNDGGAPMNFSYSIGGTDASDFQEMPLTGGGTLCNTLGGVLAAGSYCIVNVAFDPASQGTKNASIIFVDNSLGAVGSMQSVALTGVAQTGFGLTVNFSGTGSGSVSDGNGFVCGEPGPCTHSYSTGASVTLTATAQAGSTFNGWSGACSGSAPCNVTMNSSQSVTANFVPAAASSCSPGDTVWVGGGSGNWNVPGNWSTGAIPASGAHVCINNGQSPVSSVTLNVNASIGGLTIDAGNSLTVGNGQELIVAGIISNAGQITVFSNNANTFLTFNGGVTLTGGGTLTLTQVISNGQPILRNANGGALTNVNNLIQGAGQFGNNGLAITNQASGVINANGTQPLAFNSGGVTNAGLIEATAGGVLQVSITVANKNGTISASGTNSGVRLLGGASIQGGTVNGTAGGFIGSYQGNTIALDGSSAQGAVTITGTYTVDNGSETIASGSIINTGLIQFVSNNANTFLTLNGTVTLSGGGTVTMTQSISNGQPILRNANGGVLINTNNLIQGSGQFGNNGLQVTNQASGVINANGAFPLQFNSGTVTNLGLVEASAGGNLQISVLVINANATLLATGVNSAVQLLSSSVIEGGTLKTLAGGSLGTSSGVTARVDGLTLGAATISGTYSLANGSETIVSGTIINTGLMQMIADNSNTFLTFNGPVTLTGGGTLTLTQVISNGQPILRNANGGALTNVNNLIQGSGQFGNNGLPITNQANGVINANGAFPLQFNNGTITNQNLIEASSGGTLQVTVNIINPSATILSTGSGSAVQLSGGASIEGGTITAASGGFLGTVSNTFVLDGATQGALTITGTYTASNSTETFLRGTINNTGSFQVLSNNSNTFITFNGAVTLAGGGTVTLTQAISNGQPILRNANGGAVTNVNNLIQGSGQFGNNGLLVSNQVHGVINANGAFPLQFNNGTVTNQNLIEASGGGTLQVMVNVLNQNSTILSTGSGSAVQLSGGASIEGGTITAASGGFLGTVSNSFTLDGTTLGALTITGTYTASNSTETFLRGTINNTGNFQVLSNNSNTFITFNGAVTLTGGGTVTLTQAISNGQPILRNANGGNVTNVNNTIQGSGQFGNNGLGVNNNSAGAILANGAFQLTMAGASFVNQGLLAVNGAAAPGAVPTAGYTQASTGRLEVAILQAPGAILNSQLQNSGTATLDGALDIVPLNGYVPPSGSQFTVLTSNSISGHFASINAPALPGGLGWSATYNTTSSPQTVVISVGPLAVGPSTLTITDLGTGSGAVTDDLGLINCMTTAGVISGTCSASYMTGSVATLTATPAAGSDFTGWSTCSGTGQCSVAMNGTQSETATFAPAGTSFNVTVSMIGTGNGTVSDNFEQISCKNTAGVTSGTCSANYPTGTVVNLTASATQPSTFGGWLGACSGTAGCSVSSGSAVTASFVPPPQTITLPFSPTNPTGMATYNCPSNANPTPNNPCLDPNAHALALGITQVNTPFTLTVQANEVPPNVADGLCPSGATPTQDFDCRFKSFFTYQTLPNGDTIVPLCYPYANGNCVHYTVYYQTPGTEPDPSWYTGPVNWTITFNNDSFVPPLPYTTSTPRLYDDPGEFVLPNSPYGTDCGTAMLTGNPGTPTNPPIFCQFVFDITTFYDPNKKVDAGIGGKTKVFTDVVVAIPPANAGFVTVTSTPDAATVTAGSPIGFTIAISNSSAGTASNASLSDPLPAGTNISWSISPAYTGPGNCGIGGMAGSQVLSCSFGNVAPSASFSVHVVSASSSTGNFINTSNVVAANQQILSVANVTVQAVTTLAFSALTPSQSITYGTASVTLIGKISSGNTFPAAGEMVSVSINGASQSATIGSNGTFSTAFPTAKIPVSATAYPITYSFAGDAIFGPASDASTKLTVTIASQTITFGSTPTSAPYGGTFAASATASSGLPVSIGASGACSISGATVTMTSSSGTCTLTAMQAGNTNYRAVSAMVTVSATKANSSAAITAETPNPSAIAQAVTVSFSVTGAGSIKPTGSVKVTATTGESCTGTLAAGSGNCSLTFATAGPRTVTAAYSGDTNYNTSTSGGVSQVVNGASSALVVSPTSIDFGQVPLGFLGLNTVTLTNKGTAAVKISNVAIAHSGTDYQDFYDLPLCPQSLAAGKSCLVIVSFIPLRQQSGSANASLVITDSAAGSPQTVAMKATVINPRASLNPTSLSFGTQKVGTTSGIKTVTLTNSGTTPLVLGSIASSGDFSLNSTTTCKAGLSLTQSQNCRIDVKFLPSGKGSRNGVVTIKDNALLSPQIVFLSGQGN